MVTSEERAQAHGEAMWAADAASKMLGMEIVRVGSGTAEVSMRVRPDMINGWDVCHGGLIASLADSAFALACNSHGVVTVAAGFDVIFTESARVGDVLIATATERSVKGRSGVYDVTVVRSGAGDPGVVAEFRGRSRSLGRPIGD